MVLFKALSCITHRFLAKAVAECRCTGFSLLISSWKASTEPDHQTSEPQLPWPWESTEQQRCAEYDKGWVSILIVKPAANSRDISFGTTSSS